MWGYVIVDLTSKKYIHDIVYTYIDFYNYR